MAESRQEWTFIVCINDDQIQSERQLHLAGHCE